MFVAGGMTAGAGEVVPRLQDAIAEQAVVAIGVVRPDQVGRAADTPLARRTAECGTHRGRAGRRQYVRQEEGKAVTVPSVR
jgi:hypothetical protein